MAFSFSQLMVSTGVAAGALLALSSSASAFTFTTQFSPDPADPQKDITLQSITTEYGTVIDDFAYVSTVPAFTNETYTGGNSGAASSDRGDKADGLVKEAPNATDVVTSLGNNQLSQIIDTEDDGAFSMELKFDRTFNSLLFWERGQNSQLGVEVLNAEGTVLGSTVLDSRDWDYAGYKLDTVEINKPQEVGAYGLRLADLGVNGSVDRIRLFSESSFDGPDFKVVGAQVPEPGAVIGLSLLGGAFLLNRRRLA